MSKQKLLNSTQFLLGGPGVPPSIFRLIWFWYITIPILDYLYHAYVDNFVMNICGKKKKIVVIINKLQLTSIPTCVPLSTDDYTGGKIKCFRPLYHGKMCIINLTRKIPWPHVCHVCTIWRRRVFAFGRKTFPAAFLGVLQMSGDQNSPNHTLSNT